MLENSILTFGYLSSEKDMRFKLFFETTKLEAKIPLPQDIYLLKNVFSKAGKQLYVVGGSVRDYLMDPNNYNPKDIDLATDAKPREIEQILNNAKIRNFEKGEAFGVWVAHVNGEDYEIATLRQDGSAGDGRRPDSVTYTDDPKLDHARRDLTMNALFYDIPNSPEAPGQVIDYGTGIEDIKNKNVKVIGDPYERFGEDRLRIPRLVRFHSRFSDNDLNLDPRTAEAIKYYGDLTRPSKYHVPEKGDFHNIGAVSGERIQQEFVAGLNKAKNVVSYINSYNKLGLLNSVFPNLNVDLSSINKLGEHGRNPIIVLATLLKNNDSKKVRSALQNLKWSADIMDEVEYLVNMYHSHRDENPNNVIKLINATSKNNRRGILASYGQVNQEVDPHLWNHYSTYEPATFSGEQIAKDYGIKPGPEMGAKQRELQLNRYRKSFGDFLRSKNA